MPHNSIRNKNGKVSQIFANTTITYEGSTRPYEDPADYYPRGITLKGVRIA